MSQKISNVLISYDPTTETLSVSYSENLTASEIFKIIDMPVSDLKKRNINEISKLVGDAVLKTFETMTKNGLGLFLSESDNNNQALDKAYELIEERANKGDPEAQNAIASKYLSESVQKLDIGLLDKAEEWYRKAADNGYEKAKEFLDDSWESIKEAYIKKIEDRKNDM